MEILEILSSKSNHTENEIKKWQEIIKNLLEINHFEVENIYTLKQFTKIAFLFFKWKKYFFSINELKKILKFNEFWIKWSEKIKDYKLKSHFYWHAWYIALIIFKKTLNKEYSKKALQYSKKALDTYNNDIFYQIQINNNIINLWNYFLKQTNKDKKIIKKWFKIIINKVEKQLEINKNYPNIIDSKNIENYKFMLNFLNTTLKKI